MNFDEASIPILVLERIGITCVSDFVALEECDIDNIRYFHIGEDGSGMDFPRKLPLGNCLRLQPFLRWARQLAVDRGAPMSLLDWWNVTKAEYEDYRIDSIRTALPLPVPNAYRKAIEITIPSTPVMISMSGCFSLTSQPLVSPPDHSKTTPPNTMNNPVDSANLVMLPDKPSGDRVPPSLRSSGIPSFAKPTETKAMYGSTSVNHPSPFPPPMVLDHSIGLSTENWTDFQDDLPPSPTAECDDASYASSSTVPTSNETSIFINGKRFILLDDDPPGSCDVGPNNTNVGTHDEPVRVSSDDKPWVTMECSPHEVQGCDDTSGACGSNGFYPPAEFIHSLEDNYRERGAAYKYARSMFQVQLRTPSQVVSS